MTSNLTFHTGISPGSAMASSPPTSLPFPTQPKPRKKVTFTPAAPSIHIIPLEQLAWAPDECAAVHTAYELAHSDDLAAAALAAAAVEEQRDTASPSPLLSTICKSRNKPPIPTIHWKPLPLPNPTRSISAVAARLPLPSSADDEPSFSTSLRRANTTFDDFLACDKVSTWQDVDNAAWRRKQARSVVEFAAGGFKKAKGGVRKVVGKLDGW